MKTPLFRAIGGWLLSISLNTKFKHYTVVRTSAQHVSVLMIARFIINYMKIFTYDSIVTLTAPEWKTLFFYRHLKVHRQQNVVLHENSSFDRKRVNNNHHSPNKMTK